MHRERLLHGDGVVQVLDVPEVQRVRHDHSDVVRSLELDERVHVLRRHVQREAAPQQPRLPLVFLGRLDGQKGVDIMFEAISRMLSSGARAQVRWCS